MVWCKWIFYDRDNYIILQAYVALAVCYLFPSTQDISRWNPIGLVYMVALHMGPAEALYYAIHKMFHNEYLYSRYHFLHHASAPLQIATAGTATLLEHLLLTFIMGIPIMSACLMNVGSLSLVYIYILTFDYLRFMGHCNVEVIPAFIYQLFPPLKYLIYSPTYHSLHHMENRTNFCLFMPLYDFLGGTLNPKSWDLHQSISRGRVDEVPDFVFLAHIVDHISSLHSPFVFRQFASIPFSTRWFLLPFWPGSVIAMFILWICGKTFVTTVYFLRGRLHHTWVVPRYGFQYFLPFAHKGINNLIEEAILDADKLGVKVVSLAALNKNEALNGGGTLFVSKHPDLKVRVVHGNTLTAAVILNEIPSHVKEVFLTGATSKLGRAIALYLCSKGVRVLMLTNSKERFQAIQKEARTEKQKYLVQVTKYQAGQNCKAWIVGKWLSYSEQKWAPPGTHFHQFVVPPIFQLRRDCTYGKLAAMELPEDVEGLGICEYTMPRRVVHACHAGGIVHLLEKYEHHEVGAIDVDRIDLVWKAALKHGFKPVS
eukprot:TRINITY_DN19348_c0_g1_i2.p1 TRINITY_DN19348_c0_g1~~TRINITY_DN19348_c0_g1_i2.p1  ORF type:complete len:541 (+),score=61.77 TRINITY_DN19348_c0_g1_i2:236-1858(+)